MSKSRLLSYLACNGCLSAEFEACFNAFSLRFTAHDHALHYKLQILHEYVLDMLNSALYLIIHHRTIFYTVLHPVVLHLSKAVLDPAGKCISITWCTAVVLVFQAIYNLKDIPLVKQAVSQSSCAAL